MKYSFLLRSVFTEDGVHHSLRIWKITCTLTLSFSLYFNLGQGFWTYKKLVWNDQRVTVISSYTTFLRTFYNVFQIWTETSSFFFFAFDALPSLTHKISRDIGSWRLPQPVYSPRSNYNQLTYWLVVYLLGKVRLTPTNDMTSLPTEDNRLTGICQWLTLFVFMNTHYTNLCSKFVD